LSKANSTSSEQCRFRSCMSRTPRDNADNEREMCGKNTRPGSDTHTVRSSGSPQGSIRADAEVLARVFRIVNGGSPPILLEILRSDDAGRDGTQSMHHLTEYCFEMSSRVRTQR
jgi:hypothetical protein